MGNSVLSCCSNMKKETELKKEEESSEGKSEKGENPNELSDLNNLKLYVNKKNSMFKAISNGSVSEGEESFLESGKTLKKQTNFLLLRNEENNISHSSKQLKRVSKSPEKFKKMDSNETNNFFANKAMSIAYRRQSFHPNKFLGIFKIQKFIRGYLYRKKQLNEVIKMLKSETLFRLKELYSKYLTDNLKKQEEQIGISHNENSYKTLLLIKTQIPENSKNLFSTLYILKYDNIDGFYIGEVDINNNLNGRGILTLKNGSKYNGNFIKNKFTGKGYYIDQDGIYYEGNFENGILNGNGKQKLLNGCSFEGNFINGIKNGFGKEDCTDHNYEGEYKNDQKNGEGKLYFKLLKDTYEGNFIDNNITGNGTYIWNNGEKYIGNFLNGKMDGKGKYFWPDGSYYEGDYINNIKEGNGKFKWSNGKIYEGPFKNGNPNGKGILTVNHISYEVNFVDGVIKGKIIEIEKGFKKNNKKKDEDESFESSLSSEDNISNNNLESTDDNKKKKNIESDDEEDNNNNKNKRNKKKKPLKKKKEPNNLRKRNVFKLKNE